MPDLQYATTHFFKLRTSQLNRVVMQKTYTIPVKFRQHDMEIKNAGLFFSLQRLGRFFITASVLLIFYSLLRIVWIISIQSGIGQTPIHPTQPSKVSSS